MCAAARNARALQRLGKRLILRSLAASGLPRLVQHALFPGELAVLMYHAVVREPLPVPDWCFVLEDDFARQMAYLKRHFDLLPLSAALAALGAGRIRRPTAVITFDDGFQNVRDIAFPVL